MDAQNKLRIRKNLAERLKIIAKRKRKNSTDLIHLILENYVDEYTEKHLLTEKNYEFMQ